MGYAAIAMVAIAAVSGVMQGMAARSASKFEAEQYQREEQRSKLAAKQAEIDRRQELRRVLASQEAIRSAAGLDLYSGTGKALREDAISEAETDILNTRINYLGRADSARIAAKMVKSQGRQALIGGLLGASGQGMQAYQSSQGSS